MPPSGSLYRTIRLYCFKYRYLGRTEYGAVCENNANAEGGIALRHQKALVGYGEAFWHVRSI